MTRNTEQFLDGCHRYGWLICLLLSLAGNLILFAYFQGTVNQSLIDLKERVVHLESQFDHYLENR